MDIKQQPWFLDVYYYDHQQRKVLAQMKFPIDPHYALQETVVDISHHFSISRHDSIVFYVMIDGNRLNVGSSS